MMDVFDSTHQAAITLRMGLPGKSREAKVEEMKRHYMKAVK